MIIVKCNIYNKVEVITVQQCSAVKDNAVQCSAVQCSAVQYMIPAVAILARPRAARVVPREGAAMAMVGSCDRGVRYIVQL